MADASEEHEAPPPQRDVMLCPHCAGAVGEFDHFCPHCAGPVTAHAAIDPLGQVYTQGHAYRNATSMTSPRFIVVLGMWLIFGPQLPYLLLAGYWVMRDLLTGGQPAWHGDGWTQTPGDGLGFNLLKLLVIGGLFLLYAWFLWKVTRRYRRRTAPPAQTAA